MYFLEYFVPIFLIVIILDIHSCQKIYDEYDIEIFQNKTSESMGYNKWVYPKNEIPIIVNTSIFLFSFGSIDDTRTEYTIQLLLRFEWYDRRLSILTRNNELLRLEGGEWHVERLWTPSLHIPNNKEPDILQTGDRNPVLVHIYSDGKVLISKRILLNGFSKMDFRLYPLDKQLCDIEIESNELSDNFLRLEWAQDMPVAIGDGFSWNGFQLIGQGLASVKSMYTHTGHFSKLIATFTLKREFGHFILDMYIPSILFVISSWTSFWIEIPAAPARVTLGITTMLTLVTSAKTARDKLPKVSYIHALDLWIIMCTFFVFASLVEYATVNFIYNKDKRRKKKRKNSITVTQTNGLRRSASTNSVRSINSNMDSVYSTVSSGIFLKPPSNPIKKRNSIMDQNSYIKDMDGGGIELVVPKINFDTISMGSRRGSRTQSVRSVKFEKQPQDIANDIDRKCRAIFPICFLIINVIYWTVLALMSKYH